MEHTSSPWTLRSLASPRGHVARCVRASVVVAYTIGLAFLTLGRNLPWFVRWVLERVGPQTAHFLGYALLAGCLCWALGVCSWKRVLVVSVLTGLLGALLEYGQLLVPGRAFSGQDMLANLVGSVAGSVLYAAALAFRDPRRTRGEP